MMQNNGRPIWFFTAGCLYDMMWTLWGCVVARFDSCNSLLSFVHTLPGNILRCVRLYIKNENMMTVRYMKLMRF